MTKEQAIPTTDLERLGGEYPNAGNVGGKRTVALIPTTPDENADCECVTCKQCGGEGRTSGNCRCEHCNGTGIDSSDCPACCDVLGRPYHQVIPAASVRVEGKMVTLSTAGVPFMQCGVGDVRQLQSWKDDLLVCNHSAAARSLMNLLHETRRML